MRAIQITEPLQNVIFVSLGKAIFRLEINLQIICVESSSLRVLEQPVSSQSRGLAIGFGLFSEWLI